MYVCMLCNVCIHKYMYYTLLCVCNADAKRFIHFTLGSGGTFIRLRIFFIFTR